MNNPKSENIVKTKKVNTTKVSTFVNGKWIYINPSQYAFTYKGSDYYQIKTKFGLVEPLFLPNQYSIRGEPGDYVSFGAGGYKLLKKSEYDKLFKDTFIQPKTVNKEYPSHKDIKIDKKLITKIYRKKPQ